MPQAVRRPRLTVPIKLQLGLPQKLIEHLRVPLREDRVGRLRQLHRQCRVRILFAPSPSLLPAGRLRPAKQALVGPDGARHTLAVTNASLSPDLDFQDPLIGDVVGYNRDVPVLKMPGFVWAQPRIPHEEDKVVKLLGMPLVLRLAGIARVLAAGFVKKLVFVWTEPRPVNDFCLRVVGGGEIREMLKLQVTNRHLQHKVQRHDLVEKGTLGRRPDLSLLPGFTLMRRTR